MHLQLDNTRDKFLLDMYEILYRNVPKTSEEQKVNFLNWNLEIWVFFSRVMVNIVVIDRTNNTLE